jgi:type I restriction enzyme, R subunit
MTAPPGVKEVSAGYGELALVEMPAINLLTSLSWSFKNCTRRDRRAALIALSPGLPADAYAQAIEQLAQHRSILERIRLCCQLSEIASEPAPSP